MESDDVREIEKKSFNKRLGDRFKCLHQQLSLKFILQSSFWIKSVDYSTTNNSLRCS